MHEPRTVEVALLIIGTYQPYQRKKTLEKKNTTQWGKKSHLFFCMTSPVLFSSPISHWFVFLIRPRPRTFQDECLHHREVYVRLLRRNKTDYINEFKSKKKNIQACSSPECKVCESVSVCERAGVCVCLYECVCVCLYDEQSQICMDTVIGILSVFSCSLKRDD